MCVLILLLFFCLCVFFTSCSLKLVGLVSLLSRQNCQIGWFVVVIVVARVRKGAKVRAVVVSDGCWF